jgi:uncharacterized membrane protein YeaQ/YmgE (transglycosylase-associated protein family)
MSVADSLAIVGIAVAVIGAAIAIYYGRRALNPPKRLIEWQQDATPLLSLGHAQYRGVIDVRVFDRPVGNPYIGRLNVANIGRQDIDSSSFDQGRPIRFEVQGARKEATFLDPEGNPPGLRVAGNSILIGPELLHSKSKWTISFVSDGKPRVALVDSYLVNVDIRERPREGQDAAVGRITSETRAAVTAAIVGVIGAIVSAVLAGYLSVHR